MISGLPSTQRLLGLFLWDYYTLLDIFTFTVFPSTDTEVPESIDELDLLLQLSLLELVGSIIQRLIPLPSGKKLIYVVMGYSHYLCFEEH